MYGPYFEKPRRDKRGRWHPGRWRIYIDPPAGERTSASFETEGAAEKALDALREELEAEALTVERGIKFYLDYQRAKGNAERSVKTTEGRLRALCAQVLDLPLGDLTGKRAQRLYDRYTTTPTGKGARRRVPSVDTHRNALNQARSWAKWAVRRGYLKANPFADVEGIGKRSAGKEQLTIDEARKLADHCLTRAAAGDRHAVGALLCLALGPRASEACGLGARDEDDGGQILVVRGTKSKNARRRLVVPAWIREAIADKLPLGFSRYSLYDGCRRLCREAGVPEVGPQGLRGTHASLAEEAGAASEFVAASLGHSSPAITERHYATADSVAAGKAGRVALRLVK